MKLAVLFYLYAIGCTKLADNIVIVILEINEYVTTKSQNGTIEELENEFFNFKNEFAIPYIWEPSAKYFALRDVGIILKREERSLSDVIEDEKIKIFNHKNINDILLRFTHIYKGTTIVWSCFLENKRYDKEFIRELTDEQKNIILDDFRRGWLYSGKEIAAINEYQILNSAISAKRGCNGNKSKKHIQIIDQICQTLITYNTKENVEKFRSIINLYTEEVSTDKIVINDNDNSDTENEQATNYKRFNRSHSSRDNVHIIYNNDEDISYRVLNYDTESSQNADLYLNYFRLQIYVLTREKSPKNELYIGVSAINGWENTTSYFKEDLPNNLVISVTKYEALIIEHINSIKSEIEYMISEDVITFKGRCEFASWVDIYNKTLEFESVYDKTIHFEDINAALKDCTLNFKFCAF